MKNYNLPAQPVNYQTQSDIELGNDNSYAGLSKLEYAAIKIMSALASDPEICGDGIEVQAARTSVMWAKSLFAELDKDDK